jgi:hemolysin
MMSEFPRFRFLAVALGMALVAASTAATASTPAPGPGLARVEASELSRTSPAHDRWIRHFEAGKPLLVHMAEGDRALVARVFGVAPPAGDAIFIRQANGDIDILRGGAGEAGAPWDPRWSAGLETSLRAFQARAEDMPLPGGVAPEPSEVHGHDSGLPMVRFHEGQIDSGTDEITGTVTITVFRSAVDTDDDKEIHITAWQVITPEKAGVDRGYDVGRNVLGAYLPWLYRVAHEVTAHGAAPALVHYAPKSVGTTEFEKTEIDEREVGIGGSQGNGVSADGQANAGLAAKLPFDLSVSYRHLVRNELRYRFPDYSLNARPVSGGTSVQWEAPINEGLKHVLVDRVGADSVDLSEKRMTPMMRSATLPTTSVWELPGDFEGMARVTLHMGYDLNRKEWWWDGAEQKHRDDTSTVARAVAYDIALDSPFLTRETTVLLRSEDGYGACVAQEEGRVGMAACDRMDRAQMWGLDSEGRYINRANGECLEALVEAKRVVTAPCSLASTQAWEWRADRIHSAYGDRRHRLHVAGGVLKVFVDDGQFDDVPVNPHHAVLAPWAGYPKAPLAGELVPAPFGRQAGQVPAAWEGVFGAVGAEQRWTPIVLRHGMK